MMTTLTPTIDPAALSTLDSALIIAVTALALTVGFLFKHYAGRMAKAEESREKLDVEHAKQLATLAADHAKRVSEVELARHQTIIDHAKEREAWAAERVRLDGVHDRLRAEYASREAENLRKLYEDAREAENIQRREYIQNMETVAKTAADADEKLGNALRKISERLTGRRKDV